MTSGSHSRRALAIALLLSPDQVRKTFVWGIQNLLLKICVFCVVGGALHRETTVRGARKRCQEPLFTNSFFGRPRSRKVQHRKRRWGRIETGIGGLAGRRIIVGEMRTSVMKVFLPCRWRGYLSGAPATVC